MKQCRNCGKDIPDNLTFCNRECLEEHKKSKETFKLFQFELDMLKKGIGSKVELHLSRGSPVRGILRAFDQRYGKVAVETDVNNEKNIVIVKLGYVISFAIAIR